MGSVGKFLLELGVIDVQQHRALDRFAAARAAAFRELTPYDSEMTDPEAPYRCGFQDGAAVLLRLVADKLKPSDAQHLAQWVSADLRDWRILGHEVADSREPPPLQPRVRPYRATSLSGTSGTDA